MQPVAADAEKFLSYFRSGNYFLIDVRSTGEYLKGHIPGAFSLPLLDDSHRAEVGTIYKKLGRNAAVEKGFELAGPLFHQKIKTVKEKSEGKPLLIYCWRGGMRSNIMAWILKLAGYKVTLLNEGYKSFRHFVIETYSKPYNIRVLGGKTGSGKTEFLKLLERAGEQIVCLETCASHKGSVFGHLGMNNQPSQEHFENLLSCALYKIDFNKPVWVENESRAIGNVNIPNALYDQLRSAPVIEIEISDSERKLRILDEYGKFPDEILAQRTKRIEKRLGGQHLKSALEALEVNDKMKWLEIILSYYDKSYMYSNSLRNADIRTIPVNWNNTDHSLQQILNSKNEIKITND